MYSSYRKVIQREKEKKKKRSPLKGLFLPRPISPRPTLHLARVPPPSACRPNTGPPAKAKQWVRAGGLLGGNVHPAGRISYRFWLEISSQARGLSQHTAPDRATPYLPQATYPIPRSESTPEPPSTLSSHPAYPIPPQRTTAATTTTTLRPLLPQATYPIPPQRTTTTTTTLRPLVSQATYPTLPPTPAPLIPRAATDTSSPSRPTLYLPTRTTPKSPPPPAPRASHRSRSRSRPPNSPTLYRPPGMPEKDPAINTLKVLPP
jgi:hypothetical protein